MRTTFKITPSEALQAHLNNDDTVSVTIEVWLMPELDGAIEEIAKVLKLYQHNPQTILNTASAVKNVIEGELAMNIVREHLKPF